MIKGSGGNLFFSSTLGLPVILFPLGGSTVKSGSPPGVRERVWSQSSENITRFRRSWSRRFFLFLEQRGQLPFTSSKGVTTKNNTCASLMTTSGYRSPSGSQPRVTRSRSVLRSSLPGLIVEDPGFLESIICYDTSIPFFFEVVGAFFRVNRSCLQHMLSCCSCQ